MANLQKVLQILQANEKVTANLERAKEKYADKPFAVEYANTYSGIARWGWLVSLISIAGASLAFCTLAPNLPIWITLSLGAPLAVGYELLKAWAADIGLRVWLKSKAWPALLAVALLYAGSVALSTLGAVNGYSLLESGEVDKVESLHTSKVDSLRGYYAGLVADADTTLSKFETQHTIKRGKDMGRITYNMRDKHSELLDKVQALKDEQKEELKALESKRPELIQSARETMGAYLWLALGVALSVEVVIFAFRFFSEYYDYRSNKEVSLLERGKSISVDLKALQQLAYLVQGEGQTLLTASHDTQPKGGIGFRPNNPNPTENNPTNGKQCANCGNHYEPRVSWQKYCSDTCRESFNNSKK